MKPLALPAKWLWLLMGVVLAAMPFHALLTSRLDSQPADAWKEILITVMLIVVGRLLWRDKGLRRAILKNRLNMVIAAFTVLNVTYALAAHNAIRAEIVGLRTNLLFFGFFIVAQAIGYYYRYKPLERRLCLLILIPAVGVVIIGLLQAAVPELILQVFHNNAFITPERPYQFLQNAPILRLNASLWGPSQLASYLVLPLCVAWWLRLRKPSWRLSALLGGLLIMLYGTQSRGGWVAAGVGMLLVWLWHLRGRLNQKYLIYGVVGGATLLVGLSLASLRFETPLSNVLLHSKSSLALKESSNTTHLQAMKRGITSWRQQPLGAGVGAAGPASAYNQRVLYTESFYLQLLVEASLWGLGLFLVICWLVGRWLVGSLKTKPLVLPLLASFVGLGLLNLIHHAWTDAATSLLWWGSAGLILASKK